MAKKKKHRRKKIGKHKRHRRRKKIGKRKRHHRRHRTGELVNVSHRVKRVGKKRKRRHSIGAAHTGGQFMSAHRSINRM